MTHKKRIKEILILVRNEINIKEDFPYFICNEIGYLRNNGKISNKEDDDVLDYFESKKPNIYQYTSFTDGKYWDGKTAWWNTAQAITDGELPKVLRTKRRFLNILIKEL